MSEGVKDALHKHKVRSLVPYIASLASETEPSAKERRDSYRSEATNPTKEIIPVRKR